MFGVFKKWLAQLENESGRKLKFLKSDNKSECYDDRFEEFYMNRGIRKVKMALGNSHQNGLTERMNRTILECASSVQYTLDCPSSSG